MKLCSRFTLGATAVVVLSGGLSLLLVCPLPVRAAEAAIDLRWAQLIPPVPDARPKSFLFGRPSTPIDPANPHAGAPTGPLLPEGRWMSGPGGLGQAGEGPVPVVTALDGKRVRIGGYVVSLDFDATRVKEFLLVPFVGACIHVPPPPANQIVYVKSEQGFDVSGTFDPVWVTGTLKVTPAHTGLAEAGYSLVAEKIEHRQPN